MLRVYAESHAPANGSSDSTFGVAMAYFRDDFLFDAPGQTGQNGTFTFSLRITGSLSVALRNSGSENFGSGFSTATAFLTLQKNAVSFINGSTRERVLSDGTTSNIGDPFLNRTSTFTVPFTFGTPFELKVGLQVQTSSRAEFGADAIADLGHTLEWGGIASVNDSSNNPVSNYTLTTGSGTNFTQPIPEPGVATLLGIGAAAVLLALRRRAA